MNHSVSLERVTEGLAKSHWQAKRDEPRPLPPCTIGLTREAGTPGTSVAQEVGRRLGWPVYDRELLEHIAKETGLRMNLLESVDEKPQGWLRQSFQQLLGVPTISENSYVRHLVETVLSLAKIGHCVLVGRGGAHLLPRQTTLTVRLIAPRQHRIEAYARRYNVSHDEAARKVDTVDRDRAAFVKDHFRRDPAEPAQYDLLLNTARWSVNDCADMIVQALRRLEAGGSGA
jgi:cytidylate kinase